MSFKTIESRFVGTCQGCQGPIIRGELIVWSKKKGSYHTECAPVTPKVYKDVYWSGKFKVKEARKNRYRNDAQLELDLDCKD